MKISAILVTTASALLLCACASTPKHTPPKPASTPKIALVLGGGGAKGFAHVGVIDALESHGIKPDIIIGTSAGAMVGAIYASGKSASELTDIALSLDEMALMDISPSKQGLLEGEKLASYINDIVNHTPLEKLPISFMAVATEHSTGEAVGFRTGDTGQAVRASASIPKLFILPRLPKNGKKYSDGGRSALVPARFAKGLGADIVISVDVLAHRPTPKSTPKTLSLERTDNTMSASVGKHSLTIPINLDKLTSNNHPFGTLLKEQLGELLDTLPKSTTLTLPQEAEFITNPSTFWQHFEGAGIMSQTDKDASNIIIQPNLSAFYVFDTSERLSMIHLGKQATLAHMDTIKQHIHHKTPSKSPQ